MSRSAVLVGMLACVTPVVVATQPPGQASPRIAMPRQGPPMPPRDTSARPGTEAPVVGSASMSGRVVTAESGQPLRRAMVIAQPTRPPEMRRGGAFTPPRPYSTRTDEDGRYVLKELPAGEYTLTARRSGFVDMSYGQTRPGMPSRRITVSDGAALGPLDFQMVRGGVITGRVVDDAGEPAERVQVRAMRAGRVGGQVRYGGIGSGDTTDDQGHFRLFGLPPGEYLVSAEPQGRGAWSMRGPNVQGVDVDIIPTYAPGTVNPAEAIKVQVQAGLEASADIQLVAAKVATVSGRVLTSKGEPLQGGFVRLQPPGGEFMGMGAGGPVMGGGQFEIGGVAPGAYTLIVQAPMRGLDDTDPLALEAAMQPLTVEGEDVSLTVTTSPGSTARGRLIIEGATAAALANRELRITAAPVAWGPSVMIGGPGGRGRVKEDLTFEVSGLRGSQVLYVPMLPEGWWVKDVRVEGQSVVDGFDFGLGRTFTGVEIVVSARPTGLTGTVTLPTGATADDYAVVLFPEDEARWEQTGPGVPSARVVRAGMNGAFRLPGIRPGSYYVLAVPADQAEMQMVSEPDTLRAMAGRARVVEVEDGVMAPVTLTLVERP